MREGYFSLPSQLEGELEGLPQHRVYRRCAFLTRAHQERLETSQRKRAKGALFCLNLCKLAVCPLNTSVYLSFLFQLIEQLEESREGGPTPTPSAPVNLFASPKPWYFDPTFY